MFQVRLSTGLLLVVVVALALGWLADRRQTQRELQQAKLQNTIDQAQIDSLQKQLDQTQNGIGVRTMMWWPNADAFMDALRQSSDDQYTMMASSLIQADDALVQEVTPKLLELLASDSEQMRRRALMAISLLQQGSRLTQPETVVAALLPSLNDSSRLVVGDTIAALIHFGPVAQPALEALRATLANDEDFYAPVAAQAIIAIDPDADITPRLVELIERRHRNWTSATWLLARHAEPEVARRVLTKLYAEMKTEGERQSVIQAMNQIPAD